VVYYAAYLEHLEEGRSEFLASKGVDLVQYSREGIVFPVVRIEVDYKRPARYGDLVRICTSVEKIGNCSITFSQEIKREEEILIQAKIIWACVDNAMKPRRIPDPIKKALNGGDPRERTNERI
jgi:acyl-CoA thioester hydrolase